MKEKNQCGKTRPVSDPYEIWEGTGDYEGWTWKVLKKWQGPDNEAENPYARWMCAVSSPCTHGGYDYGDCYVKDITPHAVLAKGKPDLRSVMRDDVDKKNVF